MKFHLLHQKGYTPTNANTGEDDTKDSDGLTTTGVINGADNWTLDSGFYKTPKYSLGDYVWKDTNKDGVQDSDEKGIPGVTVTLKDGNGNVLKQQQQMKMKYRFDDLDSGDYIVHFEKPEGLTQTTTNSGSDDEKDADGEEVRVTITDHDDFGIDNGYFDEDSGRCRCRRRC